MAKFKLELEDFGNSIDTAFGLISREGALRLCYILNQELEGLGFHRLKEDLYSDYKGSRYLFRNWGYYDQLGEFDIKLVENRSYHSIGGESTLGSLFAEEMTREKNWLSNKDGFNFFLWFEGNIENVKFTLRWQERLQSCTAIQGLKKLEGKNLERLNKSIKYYHDSK